MRLIGRLSLCVLAPAMPVHASPPNPTEVALIVGEEGAIYQRFPTGERIYISDADPVGRSACNRGCVSAWPPVLAPADAERVGDWTVIARDDGGRQWAVKGKPVYSRFHDVRPDPVTSPGWHLLTAERAEALPPVR